jgi:hypothetical protein
MRSGSKGVLHSRSGHSLEIEVLLEGRDAGIADQHGQHPPHGWMVPKLESHVKDTECCFRDGFQDGILAVLRDGQGAARGVPKRLVLVRLEFANGLADRARLCLIFDGRTAG